MILLTSDDSLQVALADAVTTTQPVLYAAYADHSATAFSPGCSSGTTNSTTAVDWVAAPSSGYTRQVKYLSLYNADSVAVAATVTVSDDGTDRTLLDVALGVGERLEYTDGRGFRLLTATGAEKGDTEASSETITVLSIASGVVNIDLSLGKSFTLALTANVTSITFTNLPASGDAAEIDVQITQDGTGSRTVALPASFTALGGSDTAVASAANAVTVLSAKTFDQGTTWRYAMQEAA